MTSKTTEEVPWEPNPEVMKLWPDISGNTINGIGEQKSMLLARCFGEPMERFRTPMCCSISIIVIRTTNGLRRRANYVKNRLPCRWSISRRNRSQNIRRME